jgi:hypothetical protein
MARYNNNVFTKSERLDEDKKRRVYDSLLDPDFPLRSDDIYVICSIGERLDLLAFRYFGDATLWWVIAAANPELRKDSLYLSPGVQVRIPGNWQSAYGILRTYNISR